MIGPLRKLSDLSGQQGLARRATKSVDGTRTSSPRIAALAAAGRHA
jgi:hypothetical protein